MAWDFGSITNAYTLGVALPSTIPGTTAWTMAAWINPSNITTSAGTGDIGVIVKFSTGNNTLDNSTGIGVGESDEIFASHNYTGGGSRADIYKTTTSQVTTGAWQHVSVSRTSAASWTFYHNGSSQSNTVALAYNKTEGTGDITVANGGRGGGLANNLFAGHIAECACWNVVLTAAEHASLAKGANPLQVRPKSLVYYSPLIRDTGDLKSGYFLTASGSPVASNQHPSVMPFMQPRIFVQAAGGAATYEVSVTYSTSSAATPTGLVTGYSAKTASITLNFTTIGIATGEEQITPGVVVDFIDTSSLELFADLTFAVSNNALNTGQAAGLSSISGAVSQGYDSAGQADSLGNIGAGTSAGSSSSGGASAEGAKSVSVNLGTITTGSLVLFADTTYSALMDSLKTGTAQAEGALNPAGIAGQVAAGQATGLGQYSVTVTPGVTTSGQSDTAASVSNGAILDYSLTADALIIVYASVAVSSSVDSTFVGTATGEGALPGNISANTDSSAAADANSAVSSDASASTVTTGQGDTYRAASFSATAGQSTSAQADRQGAVAFAVQNGATVIGDAVAYGYTAQQTDVGYSVTSQVIGGAATEVDVTFGLDATATKTAQATAYAAVLSSALAGSTAVRDVEAAANLSVGAQVAIQASAQAQASASAIMTTALATQIIADAAIEAGITSGQILNVTFSGAVISGSLIAPDGRIFTVTAEVRAFTVSAPLEMTVETPATMQVSEDGTFTVPSTDFEFTVH